MSGLLRVAEAAVRAAVSDDHIRAEIAAGRLVAVDVGKPGARRRTLRVAEHDLDAWVEARRNAPAVHPLVSGLSARSLRSLGRVS